MRVISSAPRANPAASATNGSAIPIANSRAPMGGASSWFVTRTPPASRALATPRSSRRTSRGSTLCPPMSANVSAVPSTNSATSTIAMLTPPVTIVAARTARMAARMRLTAAMRRTRSTRSATHARLHAEQQHGQVLGERRHRDQERVARLARDEQRAGGQRDPVADVGEDRRDEQQAEPAAHPGGGDPLGGDA